MTEGIDDCVQLMGFSEKMCMFSSSESCGWCRFSSADFILNLNLYYTLLSFLFWLPNFHHFILNFSLLIFGPYKKVYKKMKLTPILFEQSYHLTISFQINLRFQSVWLKKRKFDESFSRFKILKVDLKVSLNVNIYWC